VALAVRTAQQGANGHGIAEEVAPTLDTANGQAIAFHPTQDPISSVEVCHALNANANATAAVAIDCYNGTIDGDTTLTLRAGNGNELGGVPAMMSGMQVRRLTPRECERLQGFPDNFTRVPTMMVTHRIGCALHGTKEVVPMDTVRAPCGCKAKFVPAEKVADGPRYKALGNSMATEVIKWIGLRIQMAAEASR
jgi:DNA (cytosine-5)-methyltransferase 1